MKKNLLLLLPVVLVSMAVSILMQAGKAGAEPANNQPLLTSSSDAQIGSVVAWAGQKNTIPNGWMECDGRTLSNTDYDKLFKAIGTTWGGVGTTQFKIPMLQGFFLRGVDERDSSRKPMGTLSANTVGSVQEDALQGHTHLDKGHSHSATSSGTVTLPRWFTEGVDPDSGGAAKVNGNEGDQGNQDFSVSVSTSIGSGKADLGDPAKSTSGDVRTADETRPKNVFVYWIIRVK